MVILAFSFSFTILSFLWFFGFSQLNAQNGTHKSQSLSKDLQERNSPWKTLKDIEKVPKKLEENLKKKLEAWRCWKKIWKTKGLMKFEKWEVAEVNADPREATNTLNLKAIRKRPERDLKVIQRRSESNLKAFVGETNRTWSRIRSAHTRMLNV